MGTRSEESPSGRGTWRGGNSRWFRARNGRTEHVYVGGPRRIIGATTHDCAVRNVARRPAPIPVIEVWIAMATVTRPARFFLAGLVIHHAPLVINAALSKLTARSAVTSAKKEQATENHRARDCYSLHARTSTV